MPAKTTNIIAHFLLPGLAIAYLTGDRQESKGYLIRTLWLNLLLIFLNAMKLLPIPSDNMVFVLSTFALSMFWGYSLLGAIAGLPNPARIADGEHLIRGINNIHRLHEQRAIRINQRSNTNHDSFYEPNFEQQDETDYFEGSLTKVIIYMIKLFISLFLVGMAFACTILAIVSVLVVIRGTVTAVTLNTWSIPFVSALFGGILTATAIAILFVTLAVTIISFVRNLLYNAKNRLEELLRLVFS